MRCRFELLVTGAAPARARAAGQAAIDEIHRVEALLSVFEPDSEVSGLNASAGRPVRLSVELFDLLQRCLWLHALTDGAFDPTVGPLLKLWGLRGETGGEPSAAALAAALEACSLTLLELDAEARTARFGHPQMALDLGAIGKGYAVDRAAAVLAELGCGGLIHGGTSSIAAVGPAAWPVAIAGLTGEQPGTRQLRAEALSVSAPSGRTVRLGERWVGHVLDPRSGQPVSGCRLAAVVTDSAADGDALSTALLIAGPGLVPRLAAALPGLATVVVDAGGAAQWSGAW